MADGAGPPDTSRQEFTLSTTVVDPSFQRLPLEAARLYRILGVLPIGVFGSAVAAAAAAISVDQTQQSLGVLVEAGLVLRSGAGEFCCAVPDHARDVAEEAARERDIQLAASRTISWYVATAIAAASAAQPSRRDRPRPTGDPRIKPLQFDSGVPALDWLDQHADRILRLATFAADRASPLKALVLTRQMGSLFAYRGRYGVWERIDTLGLDCARVVGDLDAEADFQCRRALMFGDLGRFAEALDSVREAMEIFEELEDRRSIATTLGRTGVIHMRRGDLPTALSTLTHAVEMLTVAGGRRDAGLLIDLADAEIEDGQFEGAAVHLREVLQELAQTLDGQGADSYTLARLRMHRGRVFSYLGRRPEAAEADLAAALADMRRVGSHLGRIEALGFLGESSERAGQPAIAREHYAGAAQLLRETGAPGALWLRQRIAALTPLAGECLGRDG
jgi:tetratricopeptide (TPR) repeat protein